MLGVARGVYYAAAMLLFGGAAFEALLRASCPSSAAALPVCAGRPGLALLAACLAGAGGAADGRPPGRPVIVQTATDTLFGQIFLLRLAALLGLGLLMLLRRGRRSRRCWPRWRWPCPPSPAMPPSPAPPASPPSAPPWTACICWPRFLDRRPGRSGATVPPQGAQHAAGPVAVLGLGDGGGAAAGR